MPTTKPVSPPATRPCTTPRTPPRKLGPTPRSSGISGSGPPTIAYSAKHTATSSPPATAPATPKAAVLSCEFITILLTPVRPQDTLQAGVKSTGWAAGLDHANYLLGRRLRGLGDTSLARETREAARQLGQMPQLAPAHEPGRQEMVGPVPERQDNLSGTA